MFFSKKPAHSVALVKDPTGTPAVDLDVVEKSGHGNLVSLAKNVGVSLQKQGLSGIRAQAMLILDYSGSMSHLYSNGSVQTLVERALGFALQIDVDGAVPVVPLATQVLPTVVVNLGNYQDVVRREIMRHGMGYTNLAGGLGVVLEAAKTTEAPIFAIVVTDGDPDSRDAATKKVIELSNYPVFIKFLSLNEIEYLRKLDEDLGGKSLVDNVNTQFSTYDRDLLTCSAEVFADAMTSEWSDWVRKATAAGILN